MSRRQRPVLAWASAAFLVLLATESRSAEPPPVGQLLETAAAASGAAYLAARDAVVGAGTNALAELGRCATDSGATWEKRLVARICYERIARGRDIQALINHDWRSYPPYRGIPEPGQVYLPVTGPASMMQKYVVPECHKAGLWYYYVELTWKWTCESPALSPRRDPAFEHAWPRWCRLALAGQPEELFLVRAIMDRLARDERLESPDAFESYRCLLEGTKSDAIPVLVQRYDAYNRREASGIELYPGAKAESYRGLFKPILQIADSRHADLLEKFVAAHPALSELTPKLAEVRARLAPPPKAEPPFRLGTGIVRVP